MMTYLLVLLGAMIYFAPFIYLRHKFLQGWADEAEGTLDDEEGSFSPRKELALKVVLTLWIVIPPAILVYFAY